MPYCSKFMSNFPCIVTFMPLLASDDAQHTSALSGIFLNQSPHFINMAHAED